MKTICVFFLICLLDIFSVTTTESMKIEQGAQITAIGDGTAYSGTRLIDSSTNLRSKLVLLSKLPMTHIMHKVKSSIPSSKKRIIERYITGPRKVSTKSKN